MPSFRPVPLPIRTFREAHAFGLGLTIYCPGCHDWRPIDLPAEQLERPFARGGRFICARIKLKVYGEGTEVRGRRGHLFFRPIVQPGPDRATFHGVTQRGSGAETPGRSGGA